MIEVRKSVGRGRGVFALRAIREGEVVERAPVIVLPPEMHGVLEHTYLDEYLFDWRKDRKEAAVVLGFGSLYNHSYAPNARYERRFEEQEIHFVAVRDIAGGEEIRVNYNGAADDTSPLWFPVET